MSKKISQEEFRVITEDFVLDLIALYSIMEERISKLLEQAGKEGWTPEEFIMKMEELI